MRYKDGKINFRPTPKSSGISLLSYVKDLPDTPPRYCMTKPERKYLSREAGKNAFVKDNSVLEGAQGNFRPALPKKESMPEEKKGSPLMEGLPGNGAELDSAFKEHFFSAVFSSVQDGVCLIDRDMNIVLANKAMERIFSQSMPILHQKCYAVFHQRKEVCEKCSVPRACNGVKPMHSVFQVARCENDATNWFEVFSYPIKDKNTGEVVLVLECFHNINKRKNTEEELKSAYNELKEANNRLLQSGKMAAIGQLSAGIAHEINNPIGYVLSNLSSLKEYCTKVNEFIRLQSEALRKTVQKSENKTEEPFKSIAKINDSGEMDFILEDIEQLVNESTEGVKRIVKISQGLKNFSHSSKEEKKPADINQGIEETLAVVWNELKYKCKVTKDFGNLPKTKCNLGQLSQVFMNLLINAAQAIEKNGTITIKTRCHENSINISISDTGQGIPREEIGRIFDPFFTTKDIGKGTGLGLSISKDIIKKHDGDLSVQSEPGIGTTFTIHIPVLT